MLTQSIDRQTAEIFSQNNSSEKKWYPGKYIGFSQPKPGEWYLGKHVIKSKRWTSFIDDKQIIDKPLMWISINQLKEDLQKTDHVDGVCAALEVI
jgi:hypothetical protein